VREGFIEVKDRKIWYSVYGENQKGVPLLVIHGGPGFVSMPQVVSDFAVERPVYFYDQLGCGGSDRADNNAFYTVDYYVNELAEVRRQLNLDNVYLMGFSWGTALACAYMVDRNPAGIKGLILCGPCLSAHRWYEDQQENIAEMSEDVRDAIENGEKTGDYGDSYQSAMMQYYYKHVCRLHPWPDYLNEAFARTNADVYNTMWGPSEFTITGTLKNFDLLPQLHKIEVPVLLTCGDNDEAGVKTVRDYRKAFPDASMAVIPDSSHMHHFEQPEIFKTIVNGFLQKI
jgi:proline iminopeptidase